jgi:small subunit ribosomal protein S9
MQKAKAVDAPKIVKKEKKTEYLSAVGRRKTAIARVKLFKNGAGEMTINEKPLVKFFDATNVEVVLSPLKLVGQSDKINVTVKITGGGKNSQAEAIRHGLSRALVELNANFRKPLKKAGFLARDARKKERKKPGLKRARRAPQWSKR